MGTVNDGRSQVLITLDHQQFRSEFQTLEDVALVVEEVVWYPSLSTELASKFDGELGDASGEFGRYIPGLWHVVTLDVEFRVNLALVGVDFTCKYRFAEDISIKAFNGGGGNGVPSEVSRCGTEL